MLRFQQFFGFQFCITDNSIGKVGRIVERGSSLCEKDCRYAYQQRRTLQWQGVVHYIMYKEKRKLERLSVPCICSLVWKLRYVLSIFLMVTTGNFWLLLLYIIYSFGTFKKMQLEKEIPHVRWTQNFHIGRVPCNIILNWLGKHHFFAGIFEEELTTTESYLTTFLPWIWCHTTLDMKTG